MISNIYAYYISQYGSRPYSRYNTHKKEELRDVYNNIVRLNRASPFYSMDISEESQKFAIDIKESAGSLAETLSEIDDVISGGISFKSTAVSDDPDTVDADYIGDNTFPDENYGFSIEVRQLATPQVNTGNYVSQTGKGLMPGTYSFDVNIGSITYDLKFMVSDSENNRAVQNKLSRLINNANIGLHSAILTNGINRTAIEITSNMTGIHDRPVIFAISDTEATEQSGAVELFGLDRTTHYPSNAVFSINGNEKISSSNVFTVDRRFELTLKQTHEPGSSATIRLIRDPDSVTDSISRLAECYNGMASLARKSNTFGSRKLLADLSEITTRHHEALLSNGLSVNKEGYMETDKEKIHSLSADGLLSSLSKLGPFKNSLEKKAKDIMINPMEYISKSIISYKNPAHPDGDTYSTSIYTGMLYNGYC